MARGLTKGIPDPRGWDPYEDPYKTYVFYSPELQKVPGLPGPWQISRNSQKMEKDKGPCTATAVKYLQCAGLYFLNNIKY